MNESLPPGLERLLATLATPPAPPAGLRPRVMAAVRARRRPVAPGRWWSLAVGATAVLVALWWHPAEPAPLRVTSGELQVETLVGYHTIALATDPLAGPAAMAAIGFEAAPPAPGDR